MGELKLTAEPVASTFDVRDWIGRGSIGIVYVLIGFAKLLPDSSRRRLFADIGCSCRVRHGSAVGC